ncbi:MAG: hypothetical protein R3E66_11420 [bacterium]
MILDEPVLITYRTQKVVVRDGLLGALARLAYAQPVLVGFVGGLAVIGIALARSPGVVQTAPAEATIIALAVLTAWVVLLRAMRVFFASLTMTEIGVVRALAVRWRDISRVRKGESIVCDLDAPEFALLSSASVPAEILENPRSAQQPWKVWVVAKNADALWAIEIRVMASEAATLPVEDVEPNDTLPAPVVSPLLELARAHVGHSSSADPHV